MTRGGSSVVLADRAGIVPLQEGDPVADTVGRLWNLDLLQHPDVEERARWLLLDTLACAAAGLQESELVRFETLLAELMPGDIRWPGGKLGLSVPGAATLGAVAACWHEACEGLALAHGRPGLHVIPVALALGAARKARLGEVLDAIVVGYEIGARAGIAMRIRPGLHVDGTWGLLGATAAAARMRGLGSGHAVAALAIASCQIPSSLYLPVSMGNTARNTYAAHAAAQGIFFAEAAAAGVTAPMNVFTHAAAHLAAMPVSPDTWSWPVMEDFLILQGYLKPFAAVRHAHYGAEAAHRWRQNIHAASTTIREATLETYPEALAYCGNRAPETPIQAQFSLSYAVACILSGHELTASAYSDAVLADPESRRIESLLNVRVSSELSGRGARLTVLSDAGRHTIRVDKVLGDPDQPFTCNDVRDKANGLLAPMLGEPAATRLIEAILFGDRRVTLPQLLALGL